MRPAYAFHLLLSSTTSRSFLLSSFFLPFLFPFPVTQISSRKSRSDISTEGQIILVLLSFLPPLLLSLHRFEPIISEDALGRSGIIIQD